jgi:hypothetical protein
MSTNEVYKNSGLGKWFGEKWVDISRKKDGKHPECGASADERGDKQKAYPKCRPAKEAGSMSAKEKKKATEQKRRVERKETEDSKGRSPNWVSHKEHVSFEDYLVIREANVPTNPELWSRAKAQARSKFDVYPCVPLDSQALTKQGWKSYHDVKIDDEILTYNVQGGYTEWQPVEYVHFYENAETIRLKTPQTNFDFVCTPNHKWVLEKNWENDKFTKSGEIDTRRYRYWNDSCVVKACDINKRMKIITNAKIKDSNEALSLESFSKYKDNWVEKVIAMNNAQREVFFASAIVYDGHEKVLSEKYEGRDVRFGFSQKDQNHGDALEICAVLLGYRVSFRTKSHNPSMRDWSLSKRTVQSSQNIHKETYKKMDVWCPTTVNGTWVMKQDGMISITGNSAYANAWAAKWYKEHGGGWKKKKKKSDS